jgi:aspartyl/asparaginyl beta-hydroxylase (cupin superfamily)
MASKLKKSIVNPYVFFFIITVILFFILFEIDRQFTGGGENNEKYVFSMYSYYIQSFPLPFVGLYNNIIRLTNPTHTHVFDVTKFESNTILQSNWKMIQQEALQLYSKKDKLLDMKDIGANGNFSRIADEPNQWKVFVLKWYDRNLENAKRLCPETTRLIDKCPDVHAAMFSILEPGKQIPPHKGVSTACLRYHLGLKIPKDVDNCYIEVKNQKYHWKEGESFIFDDTYIHSVYNNTNEPRIILFIDIERPLPSPAKEINRFCCCNAGFTDFVKSVNDVSEKTVELFHTRR